MREWFMAQLEAGFPALAGSRVAGTLVVRQELLNELIGQWLAGDGAASGTGVRVPPDLARRAIKSAAVRAESGRLLVDFDIQV